GRTPLSQSPTASGRGDRQRTDAVYGEHEHITAPVTVSDEVQPAVRIPEAVRIDLPAAGFVTRGRIVPHLYRARLLDRPRELLDGQAVLAVALVRPQPDGKRVPHLPYIRSPLRRQGGRGFGERRVERRFQVGAVQRFEQVSTEHQRHQFGRGKGERRDMARTV